MQDELQSLKVNDVSNRKSLACVNLSLALVWGTVYLLPMTIRGIWVPQVWALEPLSPCRLTEVLWATEQSLTSSLASQLLPHRQGKGWHAVILIVSLRGLGVT